MICDTCKGTGWIDNKQYYRYCNAEAYDRGLAPQVKCKRCGGSGFLVSNLNEALNVLTVAIKNKKGLTPKETKELFVFLRNGL